MPRRRAPHPVRHRSRGATALAITLLLLFLSALVALFVDRNLIFEQRIAANQYRSTLAFEAAEAGLQWAEAQLNANQRLDAACMMAAAASAGSDSFRERYLERAVASGRLMPRTWDDAGTAAALQPVCVRTAGGWSCSCPSDGPPAALVTPSGPGPNPAFSLQFLASDKPGLVRVVALGCSSFDAPCRPGGVRTADAQARVEVSLGLLGALRVLPVAALTTAGLIDAPSAAFSARNPDAGTGIAVHAGNGFAAPLASLHGPAGAPAAASLVEYDPALANLGSDRFFASYFGIGKSRWQDQPAVTRVVCSSDCAGALAQAIADRSSGAMVWVDGDVDLVGPVSLGTPSRPVVVVVAGQLRLQGDVAAFGVLYAGSLRWDGTATPGSGVQGAVISESHYHGTAAPEFLYDPAVLARLTGFAGSFARVSGSWRDF